MGVAERCSVLQCVAMRVHMGVAERCSVLQCVAMRVHMGDFYCVSMASA